MTSISHAFLVSPGEAESLLSGRSHAVLRSRPTQLRMRVGVLRVDGVLVATARVVDASHPVDGSTASEWTLHDVEILPSPIEIGTGDGPLWRRLGTSDRDRVAGRSTTDDHDEVNSVRESAIGRPSEQQAAPAASAIGSLDEAIAEERVDNVPEESEHGADRSDADVLVKSAVSQKVAEDAIAKEPTPAPEVTSAESDRGLDGARERALAFVPIGMIDVDEAHRLLIRLRDVEIKRSFPDVRPEHGILRRTMLQALLDTGVASRQDYDELIPADLKRTTDRRQVEVYLDPLIEILSRVA